MTSIAVITVIIIFALFAVYRLGRKSFQVKTLKQDVKTGEQSNEILKEQRDDRIDNVDDADRLWNDREKD